MREGRTTEITQITEFKSGLTWRSSLAILYSMAVFTPAVIWLELVTLGVGLGSAVPMCTLLLFAEIAALTGKPLSKQEATLIFGPATAAGSAGFLGIIYRAWFVKQPLLKVFKIEASMIPAWWAPPESSQAFYLRTFIHPDFAMPILFYVVQWILAFAGALFFALFLREIYIEEEKLPFPIQRITVAAIESLTERSQERLTVLAWSAVISFIYAAVVYMVPIFSNATGFTIATIPIPWIDFTKDVQDMVPGIALGVATDLMILSQGFVLPTSIILGMLIGSIARFLVINPLLVMEGWTLWAREWIPGMGVTEIFQYSQLYFWLNITIGAGFAVGLVPLIFRGKSVIRPMMSFFKGRTAVKMEERLSGPPFRPIVLLILYIAGCVGALILDIILAPGFPIWLFAIYELVLPLVMGLTMGRMVGETGQSPGIPYLNNLILISGQQQGYTDLAAWFLPLELHPGTGWLTSMKVCELTRTSISSWVLMYAIAHPISILIGFVYMSLFWQLSPIPSDLYPTPAITWPIDLMNRCVWIRRPEELFNIWHIIYSFIVFGGLISVIQLTHLPLSMTSTLVGLSTPIPVIITITMGLVAKGILSQALGREWLNRYRVTVAAGIGLGEALAIVIGVISALIIKSVWAVPF